MSVYDEMMRLSQRLRLAAGEEVQPVHWRPAADIYRTPTGWLVKLELAGVRDDEIEVVANGRRLTIRGRRCDRELVEGSQFYSLEIAYSQFERSLELPCEIDQARIASEYRNGMLLVQIDV